MKHSESRLLFFLFILLMPGDLFGQGNPTVRFPLDVEAVPGAHGSIWIAENYVRNVGSEPVFLFQREFPCRLSAVHACDIMVPPGETIELFNRRDDFADLSLIFEVTEGDPDDLVFSSHLRETHLDREPWGTEIPVARDEDYRFQPLSILNVPATSDTRISLRVFFAWPAGSASDVELEVWATRKDTSIIPSRIVDEQLLVQQRYPPQGVYGDTLQLHDLLSGIEIPEGNDRVRISVRPVAGDAGMWGFASITNNETQHVTIFESQ